MRLARLGLVLAAALWVVPALAAAPASTIKVEGAWARSTPPMAKTAAAYMTIVNTGQDTDTLLSASTPVAGMADVHHSFEENGVEKMRPAGPLDLKPGASLKLSPGGYHVMMMDLKKPLTAGQTFPVTLVFKKAGKVTITVYVQNTVPQEKAPPGMGNVPPGNHMNMEMNHEFVLVIVAGDLIRAVHLAASVLPAGLYLFALLVARPAARAVSNEEGGPSAENAPAALRAWMLRALRWCVPIAFLSGALWVGVEAVSMSGEPLDAALTPDVVGAVLRSTLFGHVWMLRAVLLAGLAVWVFRPAAYQKSAASDGVGLALAGAFAIALAWVGHAAGIEGDEGAALLGSQIAHLAATAAWLGALPALGTALALSRGRPAADFAAAVTRRFSPLGLLSVTVLVLSGIVNSWVLIGDIPGLLGTTYGHVLLVKLALVLAMLGLAAINRLWWTPRFDRNSGQAVRGLLWTVSAETALGLGVLLVVGVLGASTPATHEQPLWPFRFTLSTAPVIVGGHFDLRFMIEVFVALIGLGVAAVGVLERRSFVAAAGVVAALAGGQLACRAMVVDAYPTSFQASPVAFTAGAVSRGHHLYAGTCLACHGPTGRGDGPAAASYPPGEATVVGHLLVHREGDLFWWISHGIPGTPMPAWSAQFTPEQRWTLIQFLRAQAQATANAGLSSHVLPKLGAPAPDFTFRIGDRPFETLASLRGKTAVLLVLYSRPGSDARLERLAAARQQLMNLRIIAVPLTAGDATGDHPDEAAILARPAPEIVDAYALYGWRIGRGASRPPQHTEFLIDRSGDLRARWHLADGGGWADLSQLRAAVATLAREPFRPAEPAHHVHG